MNLRKRTAAIGALLVALHIFSNAAEVVSLRDSRSIPTTLRSLTEDWVALELGLPPATEHPSPTPSVTAAPPTPSPPPDPSPTPHIQEAVIDGGIAMDNKTDYTVDTGQLIAEGPSMVLTAGAPQILIIHTHSSEAYTMDDFDRYLPSDDSRTQDLRYNVVRIGDVLTDTLRSYGLEVVHDREIYDYPSYTGSYTRAGEAVSRYLTKYPTIAVVLDVHRDAIESGDVVYKTVAEGEGNPCAQTMLVVGTDDSGLTHPQWQENLRLALYLQAAVYAAHPTLQRPIRLVRERYNQQLTTGSLILEVGSNGNTLAEAIEAAELFAKAAGPALAELVSEG